MKLKALLTAIAFFASISAAFAGSNSDNFPDYNKLNEKRFEVIAHELNLNAKTGAKLKPLYMEYCKKMGELFKTQKFNWKMGEKSDEEVDADIKNHFYFSRKLLDIRESYYNKFKKIIKPKQIAKIYEIEQRERFMIQNARGGHQKRRK